MAQAPRYKLVMVGTDTEVFLRDASTKDQVPVIGLIGGTKYNPKPVPELGRGFFVQEDNVMLEYNVPPAKTKDVFVSNVMAMNNYLTTFLAGKNLEVDICSSMQFTKNQLSHPQAQNIGCEPDWDVWSRLVNISPKEHPLMNKIRTSGGHLHVSFAVDGKPCTNSDLDDVFLKEPLVKALDLTLGIPALTHDLDFRRRQLYGKPGAFRNKDYGIEYRTLSNFWTKSPDMIEWAFTGITQAIFLCNKYPGLLSENYSHICDCFRYSQQNDQKRSQEFMQYLLTLFGLRDRANGIPAYSGVKQNVIW